MQFPFFSCECLILCSQMCLLYVLFVKIKIFIRDHSCHSLQLLEVSLSLLTGECHEMSVSGCFLITPLGIILESSLKNLIFSRKFALPMV